MAFILPRLNDVFGGNH